MSTKTCSVRGLEGSGSWSPQLFVFACVLAVSTTCGDPEGPLIVEEGERIDVLYADEFQLCAGTVSAFDRWIEFAAQQLELDADSFEQMTYTWLGDGAYREATPRYADDAGGWAFGTESYAKAPDMFHEVTHMVGHQVKLNAIDFLSEGLATALEDGRGRYSRIDPRPYVGARSRDLEYSVAGAFVGYLLTLYGPERFWELNQELRYLSTAGRFRRHFRAVYGAELDDVVDSYMNDDICPEERWKVPVPPACNEQEVPWVDENRWLYARVIDCSDEDVVGGIGGGYDRTSVARTLRLQHSGVFRLRLLSEFGVTGILNRCGGCPWLGGSYFFGKGEEFVYLEQGIYSLKLQARASDVTPVLVEILKGDSLTVGGS